MAGIKLYREREIMLYAVELASKVAGLNFSLSDGNVISDLLSNSYLTLLSLKCIFFLFKFLLSFLQASVC